MSEATTPDERADAMLRTWGMHPDESQDPVVPNWLRACARKIEKR